MKDTFDARKFIRLSIMGGAFSQVFLSLGAIGSSFITAFANFLGAGNGHFALLTAISQLANVFQPFGVLIRHRLSGGYKGPTLFLLALGRITVLLLPAIPFLLPYAPQSVGAVHLLLGLLMVSAVFQAVGSNTWTGWIADAIPLRIRGRFLAGRSQVLMAAGFVAAFAFSYLLKWGEWSPDHRCPGPEAWSFMAWIYLTIFGVAGACGLYGLRFMAAKPERRTTVVQGTADESFRLMISPLRDRNFLKLAVYGIWWSLALGIGSPFWGPFMMNTLHMSMPAIVAYGVISTVAAIVSAPLWGRLIDRFGNKPCQAICIMLGAINPVLWIFSAPGHYGVLYVEAASSGLMWAGANLIAMNFVLAIAPGNRQQTYSGMFAAINGLAWMVTALLSAWLIGAVTLWKGTAALVPVAGMALYPEQVLFVGTGIARFTALLPLLIICEPNAKSLAHLLSHLARQTLWNRVK